MDNRYIRNIPTISESQQAMLNAKTVLVLGCGGLGGYVIEYLARMGVGHIIVFDGDVFKDSNLNRQLMCTTDNIGSNKATEAAIRIALVNPDVEITAIDEFYSDEKYSDLLKSADLVIDALDSVKDRLTLEEICTKANLSIVHGAVNGWTLQAGVIPPGSDILHTLYVTNDNYIASESCLCPTPACCAAIQVSEAVKLLTEEEPTLSGKILFMNLQTMDSNIIQMK